MRGEGFAATAETCPLNWIALVRSLLRTCLLNRIEIGSGIDADVQ
jgi:hypothetical protein